MYTTVDPKFVCSRNHFARKRSILPEITLVSQHTSWKQRKVATAISYAGSFYYCHFSKTSENGLLVAKSCEMPAWKYWQTGLLESFNKEV